MAHQLNLLDKMWFSDHESWHRWLHDTLPNRPVPKGSLVVLDLFAGCGGLALGFEAQGFHTVGYEMKPAAVETYNNNLSGQCIKTTLDIGMPETCIADVIIGGPPCQPFSQIGYQRGNRDSRDGFPILLDAVRRIRPKIAIIENVRGLLFRNKDYLRLVANELENFGYNVDARLLKAVDFGVPQKRERVVIVASTVGWSWPNPVVRTPISVGIALGPLAAVSGNDESKFLTPNMDRYIAEYERKSHCKNPRDLYFDQPSRTVTCRNLGGATSDMLRIKLPDGRRRMLSVSEGARLQSFPDWYKFVGNEYEQFEQIGNAVPPLLAYAVAGQVKFYLENPASSQPDKETFRMTSLHHSTPAKIKVDQALTIIRSVGIPAREMTKRRQERVAKAFLAVARLSADQSWNDAGCLFVDKTPPITTREIIRFWNKHYDENIADSSYDDVRRKDLIWLVEGGLVAKSAANPSADTNDGTRGYSLTENAYSLVKTYGTESWEDSLITFRDSVGKFNDRISSAREFKRVPVTLPDGRKFSLSPGPHNKLQCAIIEEFLTRYAKKPNVLYVGDTAKKILLHEEEELNKLGLEGISRNALPDIIAYDSETNWLYLIEAVHSSGPIDKLRHLNLRRFTSGSTAGCVYVTAFLTMAKFAQYSKQISWETEVWVADNPDHMIHFNGGRFLGPYEEGRKG